MQRDALKRCGAAAAAVAIAGTALVACSSANADYEDAYRACQATTLLQMTDRLDFPALEDLKPAQDATTGVVDFGTYTIAGHTWSCLYDSKHDVARVEFDGKVSS